MKKLGISTVTFVLALAVAAPAFASTADPTGRAYGQHHAEHAQERGGFNGTMNPGVVHQGFSGWLEHCAGMDE